MDIHIVQEIGVGRFRQSLEDLIKKAGHALVDRIEFASFVIGFSNSDFGPIEPRCQIILKIGRHFEKPVPDEAILLHMEKKTMIRTGEPFLEWLTTVEDPLFASM